SATLNVLPARDVTEQVKVKTREQGHNKKDGTSTVTLTVTNKGHHDGEDDERHEKGRRKADTTLTGLFAIQLSDLSRGVTLQSATVTVNGVTMTLTITHNAAGDPIINVPQSVASSLSPGQSLPPITLVFSNPHEKHVDFDTDVFLDPLA